MTLTEAARVFKRLLRVGIITLIIILIIRIAWGITGDYLASKKPLAPPPPPTVLFGKLPAPKFIESTKSADFTFVIDTLNGKLPEASSAARVYFYIKSTTSFGSLQKAKSLAQNLRFNTTPTLISPVDYKFTDPNFPGRTLTTNTTTGNFIIQYDLAADPNVLTEKNLPSQLSAGGEFSSLLGLAGVLRSELDGETVFHFLKFDGQNFVTASSATDADAVFIGLSRKNINDLPVVTDRPKEPLVWAIMSGSLIPEKRFLEVHYTFREINQTDLATYPLKAIETVWQELQTGKATIVQTIKQRGEIAIKNIHLAYFDGISVTDYLQPIFVFEGEGFTAYLPAIKDEWLE